ncbi:MULTISPECIES: sulfatase-like hydrolase/transferase [unclassified Paraflavitalea]|uniref:sulfatase-like hydrolase/transferase n=1 Tax=unclassified Paraflavitalea TaxID=2798305 RepID=UPI003D33CA28
MKNLPLKYFLLLLLLPLFFLVTNLAENYGLVSGSDLGVVSLELIALTCLCYLVTLIFIRQSSVAFVYALILLVFILFYGAMVDFYHHIVKLKNTVSYSILIPIWLLVIILVMIFFRKKSEVIERLAPWSIRFLLFLNGVAIVQLLIAVYQGPTKNEFGDTSQSLSDSVVSKLQTQVEKPDLFWIVADEYPSSRVLNEVFHYQNSLDSSLRNRGFEVFQNVKSAYNYTHYSLTSELDMQYLDELKDGQVISGKDIAKGVRSLNSTNTTTILKSLGYTISNHAIYPIDDTKFKGYQPFPALGVQLLNHQLLYHRLWKDIGWLFRGGSFNNRQKLAASVNAEVMAIDQSYKTQLHSWNESLSNRDRNKPTFSALHLYLPHEPFIYNEDGSLHLQAGLQASADTFFVKQVQYTNNLLEKLVDEIIRHEKNRPFVILIQGDHGFKFEEKDPLFEKESWSTYLAIYSSNKKSHRMHDGMNLVNTYRNLFSDLFGMDLKPLPSKQYLLRYR